MKKLVIATISMMIALPLVGCTKGDPILKNYSIHHDDEFGGAYINISINKFNNLGFKFGDSVNLLRAGCQSKADAYLSSIGLTNKQINGLKDKLCK